MTRTYECPNCGHPIEVPNEVDPKVTCPHCREKFAVDSDAEFVDGAWRDLTRLLPVQE